MTLPDISLSSWAGIMAAAAIVGTCWRTIAMWLQRLADLAICRVVLKDETARAVMSRVWSEGRRSPFGVRMFGGINTYVAPKGRVEVVAYEDMTSEPILVWFDRTPVMVSNGMTGKQYDSLSIGNQAGSFGPTTLRFIRGTLGVNEFIETALKTFNDRQQRVDTVVVGAPKRFNVVRLVGEAGNPDGLYASAKRDETPSARATPADILLQLQRGELRTVTWRPNELLEASHEVSPFVAHPIAPEILAEFDEIGVWLKAERWFRARGIPWYRGFLLASPPGAGKDTLVRNLALRYDLPIYAFDLSTYDNRGFTRDWAKVRASAPAIALCSDIDSVFHLRENIAVKGKTRDGLTFDCLLNTISGVGSSDGVILFITTNDLSAIDPALGLPTDGGTESTRPGRINKVIRMGGMGKAERRKLAALILDEWPEDVETVVRAGDGEMAAQFQERCVRLATERFWTKGVKSAIPAPPVRQPNEPTLEDRAYAAEAARVGREEA